MLFNSAPFVVFFVVVLAVYRWLPGSRRNAWLLMASWVFYALWLPQYWLLLLFVIGVNYVLMHEIRRSGQPRVPLSASILFTLGLLAFYKYALFLFESVAGITGPLFGWAPPLPEIVLPLGISFYSFQILALQIDVYRRQIDPPKSLLRYALFVSFFPQLIAGPILRGGEFLSQLEAGGRLEADRTRRGLWLIASGVVKKVIVGDFLLARIVDGVFDQPGVGGAPLHWIAVYSFAFQIYFDFSGYTDMARGTAALLGFELPLNFREPYLSRNPAEFWRRWHITLSRWLRDYLYVPLGGNRNGPARTTVNLALTMLLGGLWHGAGWNFVIWGGFHGLFLGAHRWLAKRPVTEDAPLRMRDTLRIFAWFHATCLLWVFFRAESWNDAMAVLAGLIDAGEGAWPVLPGLVVMGCALGHAAERWARPRLPALRARLGHGVGSGLIEGFALGLIAALALAASGVGGEFIYFQF